MPVWRSVGSQSNPPLAVALVFSANGFALASLLSRVPDIRDQISASPNQLAFTLVCLGVGSLIGMPFTDRLIDRYSSRWVNRIAATVRMAGYMIVPMIGSVPVLALVFLITGIGMGAGAVAIERTRASGRDAAFASMDAVLARALFFWCCRGSSGRCAGGLSSFSADLADVDCVACSPDCHLEGYR